MAQYTTTVKGKLDQLRKYILRNEPLLGATITLEEEISGSADEVKYWVGTFERYAALGENRSSLNVVLMEMKDGIRVIATASGGSQAMFLKINHWSDDNFLDAFIGVVEGYKKK